MDNTLAKELANAALSVLRPLAMQSGAKTVVAYFQPTEKYADSFMRAFRKGSGILGLGSADSTAPIKLLDIAIAIKPGILSQQWVGYTIDIADPETNPVIKLFREWPEGGGEQDAPLDKLNDLKQDILSLAKVPLTPSNSPLPKQSPIG